MPKVFGDRWEVVRDLPEGGQAYIYVVRDNRQEIQPEEPEFILKRLKNLTRIARFEKELSAGLKLKHQNVVDVLDYALEGKDDPYIVVTYYRGGSMAEAEPFNYSDHGRLLDLFGQVCDGVVAAHGQGVIHRDLKPDNIFLSGDRTGDAVVGDFGLCLLEDEPRITGTGEAVGPRLYMAPELEDGRLEDATKASDVYSLGKLLYWLMSRGRIFSREKHRIAEFDLLRVTDNPYMEHVNKLLDHMIVEDPDGRWPLDRVRRWLPITKRVVVGEYNPVGLGAQTRCNYCGIGAYQYVGRDRDTVQKENFITAGQPGEWIALVCNYCSHVEWFRPDIGRRISPTDATPWTDPNP